MDQEPEPQVFFNFSQVPAFPFDDGGIRGGPYFAVRTNGEPASITSSIRGIVGQLDPLATLDNVATMDQLVSNSISRRRLFAVLLGIFAGIAAALAAIGIYGVMAYAVTERTREIGIRTALGAERSDVMRLVLGQSMALTAAGITVGMAGAAAATRYLEGMLFGLTRLDPATFIAMTLMFGVVAAIASFVPAYRATKVDPLIALRHE